MSKIILVFTSMSGNTEMMAEAIADGVGEAGRKLDVIDIMDGGEAADLENYDGILLGTYTWADGELPDEFLDFYEEMDNVNLTGKKAAAFGSCNSAFPQYGAAVDTLIEKLEDRGAQVFSEGLKIELTPDQEDKELCRELGKSFVAFLNKYISVA
ncbi:flavodoxin [Bacillus norwichensis]|uniref:Flavodoxin n=1 Tax=Bacillus norwichensis TaxID=2762217 RepID=A0ABR8VLH4_9BACI|nr:flavodoxin [Bacillus norwichensis]MBD8005625.1 flavodoxin [Bacillus norwichensis]